MSLKRRIAIGLSIAFSLIFGIMMFIVYVSFNDFRKDEFKERFQKRLVFTVNFIEKSKDFEKEAPIFFDENSDNVLLNENIMIFGAEKNLVYSTLKDKKITWDEGLLKRLDTEKTIYNEHSVPEVYATLRKINGENYYILTSAQDVTGQSKLDFLKYTLIFSYFVSIILIWFFSYYLVSKFLEPLEILKQEISDISVHKLTSSVSVKNSNDEIGVLAKSFNLMTSRLDDVFQSQKDFNSSAAHEMRTPLTRMAFQLENLIQLENHSPKTTTTLQQMLQDVYQLSDLTKSLLLLSKFDKEGIASVYEEVRIDEVVFDAFETVHRNFPEFKMDFLIDEESVEDSILTVKGVKSLLEITFINLFKNAALYSDNQEVDISIKETDFRIIVKVFSVGTTIPAEEREKLFEAFMRGSNSHNKTGSGLGLRIVKRILEYHRAEISYTSLSDKENLFTVIFNK
ncbi:sensor histidine kinase [Epilithonimonas hungarica]|uniref:histidine kinase n=1 Tax=Epilithonimonas hungarica TaxID=454006 RepID=A0A1G7RRY7_9FLAO|nr:ATP-binding protein [Epilithonimonas hungarica]MDP9955736.1 signal transduction histidine kinase [Epilithonimonas hungarica]MPT31646.1 HAMP domain-containing protein [Chryseobacterium sp.]SDG13465.1 Signal transduction histidine kinase [Epilithonimonas hungarica]